MTTSGTTNPSTAHLQKRSSGRDAVHFQDGPTNCGKTRYCGVFFFNVWCSVQFECRSNSLFRTRNEAIMSLFLLGSVLKWPNIVLLEQTFLSLKGHWPLRCLRFLPLLLLNLLTLLTFPCTYLCFFTHCQRLWAYKFIRIYTPLQLVTSPWLCLLSAVWLRGSNLNQRPLSPWPIFNAVLWELVGKSSSENCPIKITFLAELVWLFWCWSMSNCHIQIFPNKLS